MRICGWSSDGCLSYLHRTRIDIFFFKQKTAYEMRISDWSSGCALPILLKAIVRAGLLVALVMGVSAAAARADVVDDIKERGTLIVGSKADYKPYGFLDPSGKIVGLEPELAADVAKKLGVKLELVPVEIGRAHV